MCTAAEAADAARRYEECLAEESQQQARGGWAGGGWSSGAWSSGGWGGDGWSGGGGWGGGTGSAQGWGGGGGGKGDGKRAGSAQEWQREVRPRCLPTVVRHSVRREHQNVQMLLPARPSYLPGWVQKRERARQEVQARVDDGLGSAHGEGGSERPPCSTSDSEDVLFSAPHSHTTFDPEEDPWEGAMAQDVGAGVLTHFLTPEHIAEGEGRGRPASSSTDCWL